MHLDVFTSKSRSAQNSRTRIRSTSPKQTFIDQKHGSMLGLEIPQSGIRGYTELRN